MPDLDPVQDILEGASNPPRSPSLAAKVASPTQKDLQDLTPIVHSLKRNFEQVTVGGSAGSLIQDSTAALRRKVTENKVPGAGFGIRLAEARWADNNKTRAPPVIVETTSRSGQLHHGDRLISLNGTDIQDQPLWRVGECELRICSACCGTYSPLLESAYFLLAPLCMILRSKLASIHACGFTKRHRRSGEYFPRH
jgi:hypothetical protein